MSRKAQSTTEGQWTAKLALHGWYVEFDAMNGACIDNELTAKGIANAHNCVLAAEREKLDNATENCMSLSKLLYETRKQLAATLAKIADK